MGPICVHGITSNNGKGIGKDYYTHKRLVDYSLGNVWLVIVQGERICTIKMGNHSWTSK